MREAIFFTHSSRVESHMFEIGDGGIFSPGSHRVVGTVIIRTSNQLTASQQKELEEKLIASLTELK